MSCAMKDIDWTKPDMARFFRIYQKLCQEKNPLPIGQTVLPFGSTIFDFNPDTDHIITNRRGAPKLFCYTANDNHHSTLFIILKRVSQRGYMVRLTDHTLHDITLNPGGLRYIDKMIAEATELVRMSGWEKPGRDCSVKEAAWFRITASISKRPNAYRRAYMDLYDDMGLRIKLWHKWLCDQGRYDQAMSYNSTQQTPDLKVRGQFTRKIEKTPRPLVEDDDYAEIDRRKLMPTQDQMFDGTWHSHGTPTWLKSHGNDPEADCPLAVFVTKQWTLEQTNQALIEEAIQGRLNATQFYRNLRQALRHVTSPTSIWTMQKRAENEAHEYNQRRLGVEDYPMADWQGTEDDLQEPYWPKTKQLEAGWKRALALTQAYEQIGKTRANEITGCMYFNACNGVNKQTAKKHVSRNLVGTTGQSYSPGDYSVRDSHETVIHGPAAEGISAHPDGREYHEYLLREADRQTKLQLAKWEGGCPTNNWHPAVKITEPGKTITAISYLLQARAEAVTRLKQMEQDNDQLGREAYEEQPELEALVDQMANEDDGMVKLEGLLTQRITLHKTSVEQRKQNIRRRNKKLQGLRLRRKARLITDRGFDIRLRVIDKFLALA
jgi:hypothetical protein